MESRNCQTARMFKSLETYSLFATMQKTCLIHSNFNTKYYFYVGRKLTKQNTISREEDAAKYLKYGSSEGVWLRLPGNTQVSQALLFSSLFLEIWSLQFAVTIKLCYLPTILLYFLLQLRLPQPFFVWRLCPSRQQ